MIEMRVGRAIQSISMRRVIVLAANPAIFRARIDTSHLLYFSRIYTNREVAMLGIEKADISLSLADVRFTPKSGHCYAVVMLAGRISTPDPYDAQSGVKVYVDV
jgi:hypothetical protein